MQYLTAHSPLGGAPIAVIAPHAGEPGLLDDVTVISDHPTNGREERTG